MVLHILRVLIAEITTFEPPLCRPPSPPHPKQNTTFYNNSAISSGGGSPLTSPSPFPPSVHYLPPLMFSLMYNFKQDTTFYNNSALSSGGGLMLSNVDNSFNVTLDNCAFLQNRVGRHAGRQVGQ